MELSCSTAKWFPLSSKGSLEGTWLNFLIVTNQGMFKGVKSSELREQGALFLPKT